MSGRYVPHGHASNHDMLDPSDMRESIGDDNGFQHHYSRSKQSAHGRPQNVYRLPNQQLESIQEGDDDLNSNAPEEQEHPEEESDVERDSSHDSINDTERRTIHSHS